MSDIISKGLQQGIFEALASANRFAGSGGGSGLVPASSGGYAAAGNQGGYSTANASTWTDITNTSFSLIIPRSVFFIYQLVVTGRITAGAQTAYVRGNIVGFDVTASPLYDGPYKENGFMWYFPGKGAIPAGTYTVKLQAATDANTTTLTVDQFFHQIFLFG